MRIFLTIVILFLSEMVHAQVGRLSVYSEPTGAEMYLDSSYVGRTPVAESEVLEGMHRIRLFTPSARDWNAIPRFETVRVAEGEQVRKTVELGTSLTVHSIPYGAEVFLNGENLGTTPLYYRTPRTVKAEIILRKQGFEPKTIDASMPAGVVTLTPTDDMNGGAEVEFEAAPDSEFRRWGTYSSAAVMVISGVVAAYYKDRANNRFDSYLSTNDPGALASTERNDRRSAMALVFTQISFGVLSYLLLSE